MLFSMYRNIKIIWILAYWTPFELYKAIVWSSYLLFMFLQTISHYYDCNDILQHVILIHCCSYLVTICFDMGTSLVVCCGSGGGVPSRGRLKFFKLPLSVWNWLLPCVNRERGQTFQSRINHVYIWVDVEPHSSLITNTFVYVIYHHSKVIYFLLPSLRSFISACVRVTRDQLTY